MTPYYVAPAIALVLVVVTSRSWSRWGVVIASASALTVLTYYRPGIWWYWLEMAAAFGLMLAVAWRRPSRVVEPSLVLALGAPGVEPLVVTGTPARAQGHWRSPQQGPPTPATSNGRR